MSKEALTAAYHTFARTQNIISTEEVAPRSVLWRMSALGADVRSSVEVLLSTYETAQSAVQRSRDMIGNPKADSRELFELVDDPQRRFITAFKTVFVFVRAYQDALCGFLFELQGQRAGNYTSMAKALKEGGPLRDLLDEEFPGYRDWLYQWRNDRDKIKRGAQFALFFDGDDNLTIAFTYPIGAGMGTEEERIGLGRVIEGLEMSAHLTTVAFGQVDGELYYIQWPPPVGSPETAPVENPSRKSGSTAWLSRSD
jgi:hypothetical protein